MNIKSVTFVSNNKTYELSRLNLVPNNELVLSYIIGFGNSTIDSEIARFTVTNEAVTANLIRAKVTGNKNRYDPNESLVDYQNMVAFLTQG